MRLTQSQEVLVQRYCSPSLSQYPQFELRDFPSTGLVRVLQLKSQEPNGKPYSMEEISHECMRIQVDEDGCTLDQTEVWCLFFLYCSPYGVANAIPATSSESSANELFQGMLVTVDTSSHQPYRYFKSQWRKIIEALVLRNSESVLRTLNGKVFELLVAVGNGYAFNGDTPEYDVDYAVNTFVYDTVISLSFRLLGTRLSPPPRPTEAKLLVDGKETVVKYRPDLHPLALEGYGNVIVGEVKRPSIGNWIENLGRGNTFKINIEGSNEGLNRGFTEAQSSALCQHIAYQMAGQSLVGYFTDGLFHVVTTIESLVGNVMTVQIDITQLRTGYDESPQNCPPAPLILTRIWEVIQMGPRKCNDLKEHIFPRVKDLVSREFLNGYFGEETVKATFRLFQENMEKLIQEQQPRPIFCHPIDDSINQRGLGFYSQVFSIHRSDLETGRLKPSLRGDQIVVKVHDPARCFLSSDSNERRYLEVIDIEEDFYKAHVKWYNEVTRFNEDGGFHGQRINSVETQFEGFRSFWKDSSAPLDSDNYIASGLTVFMQKLTEKPKKRPHFLAALKQLLIMEHASTNGYDVGNVDVSYENIFMYNADAVFVSYSLPTSTYWIIEESLDDFLVAVDDETLFTHKIKEFMRTWHKYDTKLTFGVAKAAVIRLNAEMGIT